MSQLCCTLKSIFQSSNTMHCIIIYNMSLPNVKPHSPCLWHSAAQVCAFKRHECRCRHQRDRRSAQTLEPAACFKQLRVKIAVKRYRIHETLVLHGSNEGGGVAIQVLQGGIVCQIHASRIGGPYVSCSINFFTSTDSGRNSTCFWLRGRIRDLTVTDNLCM